MRYGQRAKQKAVYDAKNRGVHSHPKSESHNSDCCKAGILRECPQSKTDILYEVSHWLAFLEI
jgi:predicted aldo/keto reductase-like oxidoreductase